MGQLSENRLFSYWSSWTETLPILIWLALRPPVLHHVYGVCRRSEERGREWEGGEDEWWPPPSKLLNRQLLTCCMTGRIKGGGAGGGGSDGCQFFVLGS